MEMNYRRDFMEALIQHGQGRESAFFWYSSVFLPKGVSTEILYGESQLVERTREDKAGMGVSLSASVSDNSPGHGFVSCD